MLEILFPYYAALSYSLHLYELKKWKITKAMEQQRDPVMAMAMVVVCTSQLKKMKLWAKLARNSPMATIAENQNKK